MNGAIRAAVLLTSLSLAAFAETPAQSPANAMRDAIIARVGDEVITFSQVNAVLDRSAVVGTSVPALGTPERQTVRGALLDTIISANLLYLDALSKGEDRDADYQQDLRRFSDGVLASLYEERELLGDVGVTDEEVESFAEQLTAPGTSLRDDARAVLEATLRRKKLEAHMATLRERLREGVEVSVEWRNLNPDDDALRSNSDVVARACTQVLTWGETKPLLLAADQQTSMSGGRLDPVAARVEALNNLIDERIKARKGWAAGLEEDPVYRARVKEFAKTRLISSHRARLLSQMEPSEPEIEARLAAHGERTGVPEARRVQVVVLKTREEAEALRQRIQARELTMHEAVAAYSIDPRAKQTWGDLGWLTEGSGSPALQALAFSLAADAVGGPVESPAGWHLVKVTEVRHAALDAVADPGARGHTRRAMMQERLNEYVANLRRSDFEVVVYDDRLRQLAEEEAASLAGLEKPGRHPESLVQ